MPVYLVFGAFDGFRKIGDSNAHLFTVVEGFFIEVVAQSWIVVLLGAAFFGFWAVAWRVGAMARNRNQEGADRKEL